MRKLSVGECRAAMASGDFPSAITASAPVVAVALTQSWCPQWTWMKAYLEKFGTEETIAIYWIEYDTEPFFEDFLAFKEGTFGNREIPYLRYYRGGQLFHESNYIDRGGFLRFLKV